MALEDQDKTSFVTEEDLFCYRVMPFRLMNASAIYQRLTGRSVEVYADDMLVKSSTLKGHVQDLSEYSFLQGPIKGIRAITIPSMVGDERSQYDAAGDFQDPKGIFNLCSNSILDNITLGLLEKWKGVLGGAPPDFDPKDLVAPTFGQVPAGVSIHPPIDTGSVHSQVHSTVADRSSRPPKLECPKFDGTNFRG
ncbi:Retrovirus-related Pol polyprotein from transposon 17.6 [Gossypium australe]|uniref:Retrovirus-related Pol polyprotein from transposon 17.6 n=1 Tax=Gossypium australe TaxID=47621 RepID=A0A5B6VKZ2_9ROSI|nr:Retrovirus-related Pol polyprotein from transposon 17.6 [Gossypium australe]